MAGWAGTPVNQMPDYSYIELPMRAGRYNPDPETGTQKFWRQMLTKNRMVPPEEKPEKSLAEKYYGGQEEQAPLIKLHIPPGTEDLPAMRDPEWQTLRDDPGNEDWSPEILQAIRDSHRDRTRNALMELT